MSRDSSGGAVPGATVTATNVDTQLSRDTTTDESGQYALRLLPLGNYKVDVTLTGFKTFSQTGILLEVGRNARIDATIEPGNVAESVSVVGECAARRNHRVIDFAQRRTERGPESPAGQSRPLLTAQHHRRRDEQRELELARRPRAADDDQRLAESADRIGQLPARRRQQHRRACAARETPRRIRKPFRNFA